jgi:starch-binding outer membrane protein, SusD/RagB family
MTDNRHTGSLSYRLIYIPLLLLSMVSCEDFFELQPEETLVQDKYWKTQGDVEAVLMGAYVEFAQLDDELFLLGELRCDMLDNNNATGAMSSILTGNITPSNSYSNWAQYYKVINLCNYVLEYAEAAYQTDKTFTEIELKRYESEAIFLRSLTYFYLVRLFKEVPLVLSSSRTDDQNFFVSKTTEEIILGQIKNDLLEARLYAPDFYADENEMRGRATKGSIYALLADICLWNFEYEECITYCDFIIDNMADKYTLIPRSQYYTLFYPGNSFESIFEIQFDQGKGQNNHIFNILYNPIRFKASLLALELLLPDESGENIRGPAAIRESNNTIWKFRGTFSGGTSQRPSSEWYSANWIIYRYADVLLMKAEALTQLDQADSYDEAYSIINQIRTRAGVPDVDPSYDPQGAEDAVLAERQLEFAFEGKRWYDLMRMARRNNYERKADLIQILISNVPSSQRLVLRSKLNDPYGWYMPIHVNELNANLNLVQNPYYSSFSD